MDLTQIIDFLLTLHPMAGTVAMALGTLVVVMSVIDGLLPKVNFMDKILAVPLLGDFLKALMRFSVLRNSKDEKPKE